MHLQAVHVQLLKML